MRELHGRARLPAGRLDKPGLIRAPGYGFGAWRTRISPSVAYCTTRRPASTQTARLHSDGRQGPTVT